MEQDRFKQSHVLYIIGIVSLLISMTLIVFSLYIFPYLFWQWFYDVPEFVAEWKQEILEYYSTSETGAAWLVFLALLVPGLIAGLIAYIASNHIDNQIYGISRDPDSSERVKQEVKETASILSKILVIVGLVFLAVIFFEWILYVPPRG